MVVTNNEPGTATGFTIADPMPAANTFVSASTSQGSCTGGQFCTKHGKPVKGIHVRITGPKRDARTKASNGKGVTKHTLKMKKAGILIFTPIAGTACNTKRVGVTNVFTPLVTG